MTVRHWYSFGSLSPQLATWYAPLPKPEAGLRERRREGDRAWGAITSGK